MPIIAGQPQPPVVTVAEDVGFWTATWYAPDGTAWPLTDEEAGWWTLADGVSGLDAAGLQLTSDKRARGGVRVRHIHPVERTILWPLRVETDSDHQAFAQRWRQVMRAFTQTTQLGPGWLEIARPDGSARRISAYYQEGFEGQAKAGYGVTHDHCVLSLLCEEPYWQDADPQLILSEYSAAGVDFQNPYPSVSSAQVLGARTIVNPGDVAADMEWTITGPAATVTIALTGGGSFTINPSAPQIGHGPLLAGQKVTIRTWPPSVRYQTGANWTGALNWPGAQLWSLPPGTSTVTFTVTGSGAGTRIDGVFYPRYEAA